MEADELVSAALAGDQRALKELYRRIAPELERYFARRVSSSEIDDLVQTTIMAVFAKLNQFKGRGHDAFMRWIYGFARFEAQQAMRSRKRRDARHEAYQQNQPPPPTSLISKIARMQKRVIVRRALTRLNAKQRRAIENDLEGGNAKTLAKALELEPGAARMLQTRARRKLYELVHNGLARPRSRPPAPRTPTRTPTPTTPTPTTPIN